jgi:hypothetical protein
MVITQHAHAEAQAEGLNLTEVRASVVSSGEIIEDYPHDKRGPSCLIFSMLMSGSPVHTCWGYSSVIQ